MDCPFLKYKDGAWLGYEFICKVSGRKIGDENGKIQVESTCRKDFYRCPYYRKERG